MKPIFLSFTILFISTFTIGQNDPDDFIINNVTVFDGQKIIPKADVFLSGGQIQSIVEKEESDNRNPFDYSQGTRIIDGTGKFLMPGLMNAHVHAWMPAHTEEAARAGVLTVFDMMGNPFSSAANKKAAENPSNASYFSAGYGATVPGGHGTQFGMQVPTIDSLTDIPSFVKARKDENVDYLKILYEPWRATFTPNQVKELIEEGHKHDLLVVTHISRVDNALEVAEFKGDGLVHIWFDRAATQEEITKLTDSDIWMVPTMLTTKRILPMITKNNAETTEQKMQNLINDVRALSATGMLLLAGTDPPNAEINYGTDLYQELYLFKEAGLENLEILKTATSNIAQAFELTDRGSIQKGMRADLLLISGNPFENIEDIEKIERIWKGGELVR